MWGCVRVEHNHAPQMLQALGSRDRLSDAVSCFRKRRVPVWWCTGIPELGRGHRVTKYPQDTITVFGGVLQGVDESGELHAQGIECSSHSHRLCVFASQRASEGVLIVSSTFGLSPHHLWCFSIGRFVRKQNNSLNIKTSKQKKQNKPKLVFCPTHFDFIKRFHRSSFYIGVVHTVCIVYLFLHQCLLLVVSEFPTCGINKV